MSNQCKRQFVEEFLVQGAIISEPFQDRALGASREPRLTMAWGQAVWSSSPNESYEAHFYAPDFYLKSAQPWLNFSHKLSVDVSELKQILQTLLNSPDLSSLHQSRRRFGLPDKQIFERSFSQIKGLISRGEVQKMVPVVFADSDGEPCCRERCQWLLKGLEGVEEGLWLYGFWGEPLGEGMLGVSPELLLEQRGQWLKTMALAGTDRLGTPDLLGDAKQCHEHLLVVQDIKAQLESLGELCLSPTYEWLLPRIKHLRTDLTLRLKQVMGFESLIRKLHPTPALGAFPRGALGQVAELDKDFERGRFGAPFGLYNKNSMESSWAVVAIRNVQWANGRVFLGTGCGVVSASELESEWQELQLKRQVVLQSFGLEL